MTFSILCQLHGGCLGCCGKDFSSKERIERALQANTAEFKIINPKVKAQLLKFRDRYHPADLYFGVCRNIIKIDGKTFCPLHPKRNNDEDLRINHCNPYYLCRTAIKFNSWKEEKKNKFLQFIESKKLDDLDYSILIDNGKLLDEFEEKNNHISSGRP